MPIWTPKHRPSYKQGFAKSAAESDAPELWKGCVGLWMPSLGPTGLTLRDISGYGNHGTLTNMDPATDWVMTEKGWALDTANASTATIDTSLDITGANYSIGCLCKPTAAGSSTTCGIIADMDVNGTYGIGLGYRVHNEIQVYIAGNGWHDPNYVLTVGSWYQLFVTHDVVAEVLKIYAQGREILSAGGVAVPINSTRGLSFSQYTPVSGVRNWPGLFATCIAYSRVLAPNEIQLLYQDPFAMVRQQQKAYPAAVAAGGTILPQITAAYYGINA